MRAFAPSFPSAQPRSRHSWYANRWLMEMAGQHPGGVRRGDGLIHDIPCVEPCYSKEFDDIMNTTDLTLTIIFTYPPSPPSMRTRV